jgi:hypothetical protein
MKSRTASAAALATVSPIGESGGTSPAVGFSHSHSDVPSDKRCRQPQPLQPITESFEVLLHPVLDDVGAVPDVAQVRIDPLHHH